MILDTGSTPVQSTKKHLKRMRQLTIMNTASLVLANRKKECSPTSPNASSVSLWAGHGFDRIKILQSHAGIDAHRNENQTIGAEPFALPLAA